MFEDHYSYLTIEPCETLIPIRERCLGECQNCLDSSRGAGQVLITFLIKACPECFRVRKVMPAWQYSL